MFRKCLEIFLKRLYGIFRACLENFSKDVGRPNSSTLYLSESTCMFSRSN